MSIEELVLVALAALVTSIVGGVSGYGAGLLMPLVLVPPIGAQRLCQCSASRLSSTIFRASRPSEGDRLGACLAHRACRCALLLFRRGVLFGSERAGRRHPDRRRADPARSCAAHPQPLQALLARLGCLWCGRPVRARHRRCARRRRHPHFAAVVPRRDGRGDDCNRRGDFVDRRPRENSDLPELRAIAGLFLGDRGALYRVAGIPGAFIAKRISDRLSVKVHTGAMDAMLVIGGAFLIVRGIKIFLESAQPCARRTRFVQNRKRGPSLRFQAYPRSPCGDGDSVVTLNKTWRKRVLSAGSASTLMRRQRRSIGQAIHSAHQAHCVYARSRFYYEMI